MRRAAGLALWAVIVASSAGHAQEGARPPLTLRGRVIDTAFQPVSGVLVYLSAAGTFSLSDDDGTFALPEVDRGTDTLQLRGRGYLPLAFHLFLPDSLRDTIDVGVLTLPPGPLPTLSLDVTVQDTLENRPVAGAEVVVNGQVVGRTDTAGTLTATVVPIEWGINTALVRRVGYSPLYTTFWVDEPSARRSFGGAMLKQAVDMPVIVVEADRTRFIYGRLRDFYRRRESGFGWFITRSEFERRMPIRVSDLLRNVPGIVVQHVGHTTQVRSVRSRSFSGAGCQLTVWINEVLIRDIEIDFAVVPQEVEAIEVYTFGETPFEYLGPHNNQCGAVGIWTR